MKSYKSIRYILLIMLVVAGMLALANSRHIAAWWKTPVQKTVQSNDADKGKDDPAQLALVNEMTTWLKQFDSTNTHYYLQGLFTAVDKADTAGAMHNISYEVSKAGTGFYMRMGNEVTINTPAVCLFVDPGTHKMMVTYGRSVMMPSPVPVKEVYNNARSEGFLFEKRKEGNLSVISMQNAQHPSYKEFTIHYDSTTQQVKKMFMRQADVMDFMNPEQEKWMQLVIHRWKEEALIDPARQLEKYIIRRQDQWQCTPAYNDYALIVQ